MKKIISLICVAALLCAFISSCGKNGKTEVSFVKMNAGNIKSANMSTGGEKDINSEEYYEKIAEAYNSVTEIGEYKTDGSAGTIWIMNVVCEPEGSNPTIYTLSYVGSDVINVMINGAASKGSAPVKYSVVNPGLVQLAEDELRGYAPVNLNVTVTFAVAEGVPDAEAATLSSGSHVVTGTDAKRPTASLAISTALFDDYPEDKFEMASTGDRLIRLEDFAENYITSDDAVEMYRWKIAVNGEELEIGEAGSYVVEEGDEITATFCYDVTATSN